MACIARHEYHTIAVDIYRIPGVFDRVTAAFWILTVLGNARMDSECLTLMRLPCREEPDGTSLEIRSIHDLTEDLLLSAMEDLGTEILSLTLRCGQHPAILCVDLRDSSVFLVHGKSSRETVRRLERELHLLD